MLPSDMNLRIGKVKNYNNKTLIASPSFKIGTNLKINLDGEQAKLKDKPDVRSKEVEMVQTEPDVKPKVITKPNIEPNKNTNNMLNLTSSPIKSSNMIQIRSPMRKKRLL